MSLKITNGNAGIVIDTDLQEFYMGFLDKVAPNAKKIIDSSLEEIQQGAVRDWPVRQPEIREKDGKIVFFRITTKESWRKFERGYRITPDGGFEGYLRNTAPYSWAIKFGVDSENNQGRDIIQPQGRRVATELMVKPQKKQSKKVISALADDLMRRI